MEGCGIGKVDKQRKHLAVNLDLMVAIVMLKVLYRQKL